MEKIKTCLRKCALIGVTLSFALLANPVFAIEYGGIGGRPANPRSDNPRTESIFLHTLDAGSSVHDAVRVINNSESAKTLTIYSADSTPSSGGGFACKQFSETQNNVGSWIKLAKTEVTLEAKTNEVVDFDLSVPTGTSVGEHNGCILIQEKKVVNANDAPGANLSFRTGLRVAVTVPGDIERKLELAGFSVSKKENGKFNLQPRVKNTGNVSIDADVKVPVVSFLGISTKEYGGQYSVLRGEVSEYNFELEAPFWGGWYSAQLVLTYDPSANAVFGNQVNENSTTLKSDKEWFFVFPTLTALMIELSILAVLIVLIVLLIIAQKRKRWIAEEWINYTIGENEDVSSLAKKFDVSWKLLVSANKLTPPYTLKSGTLFRVPPSKK